MIDPKALELLKKSAATFRAYEALHRAKLDNANLTLSALEDTVAKADANAAIASEIEFYIEIVDPAPIAAPFMGTNWEAPEAVGLSDMDGFDLLGDPIAPPVEAVDGDFAHCQLEAEHSDMVRNLQKPGEDILITLTPEKCATLHMGVGVGTEAGELNDALKRWVFYNKDLDRQNVIEELGDLEFYMEGIRQDLGIDRDETLRANMAKLLTGKNARYAKGYTDQAAIDRVDKRDDAGLG